MRLILGFLHTRSTSPHIPSVVSRPDFYAELVSGHFQVTHACHAPREPKRPLPIGGSGAHPGLIEQWLGCDVHRFSGNLNAPSHRHVSPLHFGLSNGFQMNVLL
jgi:hypothetical protein